MSSLDTRQMYTNTCENSFKKLPDMKQKYAALIRRRFVHRYVAEPPPGVSIDKGKSKVRVPWGSVEIKSMEMCPINLLPFKITSL